MKAVAVLSKQLEQETETGAGAGTGTGEAGKQKLRSAESGSALVETRLGRRQQRARRNEETKRQGWRGRKQRVAKEEEVEERRIIVVIRRAFRITNYMGTIAHRSPCLYCERPCAMLLLHGEVLWMCCATVRMKPSSDGTACTSV